LFGKRPWGAREFCFERFHSPSSKEIYPINVAFELDNNRHFSNHKPLIRSAQLNE